MRTEDDNADREFLALVQANQPRLQRICRVYAWQPADQNDLYQEVLFQIWRGLPGLRTETHAHTWLYRVALNTAISFARRHVTRGARQVSHDPVTLGAMAEASQPGTPDVSAGPRADLHEAISQLDHAEKALVTLFLEDLSYEEIAAVMGLSVSHVGVRLHRAKKKLAGLMQGGRP